MVSGFVSAVSWRWSFWTDFIFAGASLALLLFTPETYEPTILLHRAQRMRKKTGNLQIFAPIELETKGTRQMVTVILMRPLRMLVSEGIVLCTCLYLSLSYGIFCKPIQRLATFSWSYMLTESSADLFFVAYPLIFTGMKSGSHSLSRSDITNSGIYGMTPGIVGLTYLPSE